MISSARRFVDGISGTKALLNERKKNKDAIKETTTFQIIQAPNQEVCMCVDRITEVLECKIRSCEGICAADKNSTSNSTWKNSTSFQAMAEGGLL